MAELGEILQKRPKDSKPTLEVAKMPTGNVQELFMKLDLLKYYPRKLTLQDAVLIRQETLGGEQCDKLELLPYFILQKLMMHDYRCRSVLFQERTTSSSLAPDKRSQQYDDSDDSDDFDDFDDSESSSSEGAMSKVHPMDGLLALLHSSNNFLRQELMTRLSTCQLAMPFLLPDPITHTLSLSLWAMRTIAKEWKRTDPKAGKIGSGEHALVSYPAPIVSFCRLTSNRSEFSKSRLLNDVISDSHHDYFFHFYCEGGGTKSVLIDGLLELCWYLPSGQRDDPFAQVITFTNLRGDAMSHPTQTEFLSQVSFMNFVLLTEDDLDEKGIQILQDLAKAPGGIVLMFLDKKFTPKRAGMKVLMESIPKEKCFRMKLNGKRAADITISVRDQINKMLSCSQHEFITIENCAEIARANGIDVDEDDPDCVQGRGLASEIQEALAKLPTSDKDAVLPLQGRRLWHEWAMHDKEQHRHINRGMKGIEQYNAQKENEKLMIRMQQLSIAESPSPVMKIFLSNLLTQKGNVRNYFLQWLKFILDDLSRQKLPKLFRQYQNVRMELLRLQRDRKSDNEEAKQPLIDQLEALNDKLVNASFGLEHFLREMGQVYEAAVEQKSEPPEVRQHVNRLPQVAAELLASGYPLELMDGDASHVPLRWVMAVLDKLRELLRDTRLFVISIVGIQSTGKSTLLNTMFGLRFMVSQAGRRPRGAFMQLLPLNESLSKQTECDYLLVIDTEGLRAPELSLHVHKTHNHDNELATFFIGLANVTLINIFGETPGDMDDILQGAVHAFIRMEHVGLKPSCQFVHQNVGAVSGASRGMMGRVNFQEKLNAMTRAAAAEESLEGHYTMFNHVIDFNEEKDVCYLPGMWKGDPPMAPVNPGYSDGADHLKSDLIEKAKVGSHCRVSTFQARIQDLWKAILHEDFIFSFKNTLENAAYNQLDAKYAQWSWEFQRRMLEWQEKAENVIGNSPIDKLSDLDRSLRSDLSKEGEKIHADLQIRMKVFFEEDEQRDILVQWQMRFEQRLADVRHEQEKEAEQQCRVLISSRQAIAKADSMKQSQRDELLLLVKRLVSGLEKGPLNEKQLEQLYEQTWLEWMTKLKSSRRVDLQSEPAIDVSLENSLKQRLHAHNNLLNAKLSEAPLRTRRERSLKLRVIPDTHITANRAWGGLGIRKIMARLQPDHIHAAEGETQKFLRLAKDYLERKRQRRGNFNPTYCNELLIGLLEAITDAQKECPEFSFTPEYKVDIALAVSGYAMIVFEQMAEDFRRMNDPVEYLEREMKVPFLRLFKSQYYQTAQEKTAACNLCDWLARPIKPALIESLTRMIVVDMKSSSPSFATKRALKVRILTDPADKRSFHDYAVYLNDVERGVRKWVQFYTEQHCRQSQRGKTRLTRLAESELERLVALISTAAKEVTYSSPGAGIEQWLARFHSKLMKNLSLDLREMQYVVRDINDLDNFTEELCKRLAGLNIEQFVSLHDMEKWDEQPHDILMKTLIGCCEQCPFCKEQCEFTNPNHSGKHSVSLHRPQCLGGYSWPDSSKMILETCNSVVASDRYFYFQGNRKRHPYRRYQEIYPTWSISPDPSLETASYWKWFVATYTREIADLYRMKPNDIPQTWRSLTPGEVKEDLKRLYLL